MPGIPESSCEMAKTHAVGIDLGTTYSCISYLNEHGEPVTLANQEGELSTPSVVLFDKDAVVVGTEALRNAVARPQHVVQNAKRFMGDVNRTWRIDGHSYTPVDISTLILKKMLSAAAEQIGRIEHAVITVPAQFSDAQRQATMQAGLQAGLTHVDIINEPVAAALCHVLGTEGIWFTELATKQRILVYDLGGGTFDLSLVSYRKNEITVIASSGDLNLGGIDWNHVIEQFICDQFAKEYDLDPRSDASSLQFLSLETENAKRALTVRQRAALTCQHAGYRKTYQLEKSQFEQLTRHLAHRTAKITQDILAHNSMGWAHVDVILTTGGASRMPMVRDMLKELGGRTLNTSLSPDQSIAHGATYFAGMLLSNKDYAHSVLTKEASARLAKIRQHSVNARALGILVRDPKRKTRFPHELIPANTPLPASVTQRFGTVVPNQKRVHVHIVEGGATDKAPFVELGTCLIEDLPTDLPEGSEVAVTLSYDDQARVHVSAKDVSSGRVASTLIVREENLAVRADTEEDGQKKEGDSSAAPPVPAKTVTSEVAEAAEVASPVPAKTAKTEAAEAAPPKLAKVVAPEVAKTTAKPAKAVAPEAAKPAAAKSAKPKSAKPVAPKPRPIPLASRLATELESASQPVPLCNQCGEPLDGRNQCPACKSPAASQKTRRPKAKQAQSAGATTKKEPERPQRKTSRNRPASASPAPVIPARPKSKAAPPSSTFVPAPADDDEIIDLSESDLIVVDDEPSSAKTSRTRKSSGKASGGRQRSGKTSRARRPSVKPPPLPASLKQPPGSQQPKNDPADLGEDEFWNLIND